MRLGLCILVGPDPVEAVSDEQHVYLARRHVYPVSDYHPGLRFDCFASLGDHQQGELAHSEQARDALLVMVGTLREKEAFSVPGELVHLFPVLLRRFEQFGGSRDRCDYVPQYGQSSSWLFLSHSAYEILWAYRCPFVSEPPLTGGLSQPVAYSIL